MQELEYGCLFLHVAFFVYDSYFRYQHFIKKDCCCTQTTYVTQTLLSYQCLFPSTHLEFNTTACRVFFSFRFIGNIYCGFKAVELWSNQRVLALRLFHSLRCFRLCRDPSGHAHACTGFLSWSETKNVFKHSVPSYRFHHVTADQPSCYKNPHTENMKITQFPLRNCKPRIKLT